MAEFVKQEKREIVFDDGRRGTQWADHYDDGSVVLNSVVVHHLANGTKVRRVYARKSDLMARVYSLSYLAPATWELV